MLDSVYLVSITSLHFLPWLFTLRVLCAFAVSLRFAASLSQHRVKRGLFDSVADSMGT
jgi:hypothetical protein